jgi:probable H4MPT-linked C1 transfer pathway protein
MSWLGLDIGGANLKAADGLGSAFSKSFPLWKQPGELTDALKGLLACSPEASRLAVTMTGELADCFDTKAEGVRAILDSVDRAAQDSEVHVYLTDGRLVPPRQAIESPLLTAASNWHALARFAGRYVPDGAGLLVDIGSTTCDIIPLVHGAPAAHGCTDPDRLLAGELLYTGVTRSPVCAIVDRVPWRENRCPVAQELFATTWDVYLVLGGLEEQPDRTDTADGRPATKEAAHSRLARMLCADGTMVSFREITEIARAVADAQLEQILKAARQVVSRLPEPPDRVVVCGEGEFMARQVVDRIAPGTEVISLGEKLGEDVSKAATAHALAVIARETEP